jgi:hypothetical protein
MGKESFIERIRRQREEDQRARTRQSEADQESLRESHQAEIKRREDERRRTQLKRQALERSSVPQVASDLATAMDKQLTDWEDGIRIVISESVHETISNEHHFEKYIPIIGMEDGSVEIGAGLLGRTLLTGKELLDYSRIEGALERAYSHPVERTYNVNKLHASEWQAGS